MADVDEIIDYIKTLQKGFDKDLFEAKIGELAYIVDTDGLDYDDFHTLFKVWLNLSIPITKWTNLGRCIVTHNIVEERTVDYAFRWILANYENQNFSRVGFVLDWLTAAMDSESIDMAALDSGYELFYTMLTFEILTTHSIKLVYTLTKPSDVTRSRVLELLDYAKKREAKKNMYRHLLVLLGLFKSYKPEYVPEDIPAISVHTCFSKINAKLIERFKLSRERRNKQTKEKHHLMWVNPINMKRGNKKVDPLVPNMEFLNIGSKQYSENASKKNYLDFSDPVSLLQYRVQCRSSRPARLRALLCNVPGVALLAVSSRADHAFLAHDLQHLLINCFFEVSPYSYIEKQDFLNRLIMLQRTMLEGLPVVTNFLGQYIPFWNEKDYFAEILDLVEWLNVENPEQVMTIVDILSRVYHRSTPMQQCAILRSLTNMYTNMIYSRTRKEHYFMTSTPSQASYNQLLPQIAASLSDLCNKGLQVAPDDIRVLYTSMWSAERTSLAERQTRAPLGALPGRLTLALPLLGQSAALLDKIAALMLTYKHILSTMRSIVRDKSPSYTQHIQTLQAYTSDLIACLYTEAALSNQSTGLVFQKLLPELVSTLSCLCPDVDAKFSLRNHIAFAPYTYMQLEAIDHSETSNKIWFDTVIDHEFPNLSKFLKKAVSELR